MVTIEIDQTRAFDTEWNPSSQATGFVVDAERGLILTNRHVVTPGPVIAKAVFLNREEVELLPGVPRPGARLRLLSLRPGEAALHQAALRCRCIRKARRSAARSASSATTPASSSRSSPARSRGSIARRPTTASASTTTSTRSTSRPRRARRAAPRARRSSTSTAAWSRSTPAAATARASSFYLPLDRVKRALELIQAGKPVRAARCRRCSATRRTTSCAASGCAPETETEARRKPCPALTGMLVVSEVQPGSAGRGRAAAGRRPGAHRTASWSRRSSRSTRCSTTSVGKTVDARGRARRRDRSNSQLQVEDLHAITPDAYLEFGDAVVHTLSYQMARHFNVAGARRVRREPRLRARRRRRAARRGDHRASTASPSPTLADFEQAVAALPDGERATRALFDARRSEGHADARACAWTAAGSRRAHACATTRTGSGPAPTCADTGARRRRRAGDAPRSRRPAIRDRRRARAVAGAGELRHAVSRSPGITERNYHGTGLIVDAERGLVVVDRNTVPVAVGRRARSSSRARSRCRAASSTCIRCTTSPIVSYDPKLIGTHAGTQRDASIRASCGRASRCGSSAWAPTARCSSLATSIASVEPVAFPLSRTLQFRDSQPRNRRASSTARPISTACSSSTSGAVRALWSSFADENGRELVQENRGIPAELVRGNARRGASGEPLYSLEAEFALVPLAAARAARPAGSVAAQAWRRTARRGARC